MNSKWTIYIGILISIIALGASVTTPEVRKVFGLETNQSSNDSEMKEVELTVQTDSKEPLLDVNVEFKSQGPPGTIFTDSNGYAKIKIPTTTDVQVTLRKEGFTTNSYVIDLKKDPILTRTYMLKKTSSLTSQTSPSQPTSVPTPAATEVSLTPFSPPSVKLEVECKPFIFYPDGEYKDIISVANKAEQPLSRFFVNKDVTKSLVCKIQQNSGNLLIAYGLPDDSVLNRILVKVYVDGNLRKSINVSRGQALKEKIDVKGASGYKLEFSMPDKSNNGDYVYTLEN
ncbi:hypothetical protein [Microcoleus sp. bin38.metabat.b11b12b14.051]|uniref:hypothetical protein n=1 Tax=Microcoleus sp. bin38.metabat.b11b12b14.051 TaxID=2742709 RepID=UPI0025DF4814|nr:hypothetical protein [Microcoleus sp. bin38.metabat.b11b12b14.051]